MATWSSFEKDKLIIEGFRDFFKKKGEPAGTYPASELTTIINLISNLAKKLNIEVNTSAIVDEFEAVLKSENYNLQEQEDKIMIGGDVPLDLTKTPKLRAFVKGVAEKNPKGLNILLKALKRGAFDISGYKPVASSEQTPAEEPKEIKFPIEITIDEFSKFINDSQFKTIETMFRKLGVNKKAEEIKKDFITELPSLFRIFDSELNESDVGDYFRLQTTTNETIDITKKIKTNNPRINLMSFLFGALKSYIKKRSNEVQDIVGEPPSEVLTQLQNSVSGLTNKTLKSILNPKRDAGEPAIKHSSADSPVADEEEAETEKLEPTSSIEPEEEPTEKTSAQTFVDLLNIIDAQGHEKITVELFNNFVKDLTSFMEKIDKKKSVNETSRNKNAPKLNLTTNELKEFLDKNEKYKVIFNRLGFAKEKNEDVVNLFLRAFEQVAKSLSADTPAKTKQKAAAATAKPEPKAASPEPKAIREPAAATPAEPAAQAAPEPAPVPEPARQEEEPREKSPDPSFTRRTTKRIKDYYNRLEITEKLPHRTSFNQWKKGIEKISGVQSIEKQTFEGDNSLFVITLDDGQQFGLPKQAFNSSIEFAFEENGTSVPGRARLKDVITLAKIEDGKIIKKGLVEYDDSMKESLMLRWKTIAGIK